MLCRKRDERTPLVRRGDCPVSTYGMWTVRPASGFASRVPIVSITSMTASCVGRRSDSSIRPARTRLKVPRVRSGSTAVAADVKRHRASRGCLVRATGMLLARGSRWPNRPIAYSVRRPDAAPGAAFAHVSAATRPRDRDQCRGSKPRWSAWNQWSNAGGYYIARRSLAAHLQETIPGKPRRRGLAPCGRAVVIRQQLLHTSLWLSNTGTSALLPSLSP